MECPVCKAPVPYMVPKHIRNCRIIELALLSEQLAPTVQNIPPSFEYWEDQKAKR